MQKQTVCLAISFLMAIFFAVNPVDALPPDLTFSDSVDGRDLISFSRALQSGPGQSHWKEGADLDKNRLVNADDLAILVRYFGLQGRVRRIWVVDGNQDPEASLYRLAEDGALVASFTGFTDSRNVTVNSGTGQIWVADYGNNVVARLDKDGNIEATIGGFTTPLAVEVYNATGQCWVLHKSGNESEVVLLEGDVADGYDLESDTGSHVVSTGFSSANDLSVNQANGVCWVADSNNDQVVKMAADNGSELGRYGGLDDPFFVAVNSNTGECWIVDYRRNQLVKFTSNGLETVRTGNFRSPAGVAVDPSSGACVVTDTGNYNTPGRVYKFDAYGVQIFRAGESQEDFQEPFGPFIDPSTGNIWVADKANHEVVKLSPVGEELLRVNGFSTPVGLAMDQGENAGFTAPTADAYASPKTGDNPLAVNFSADVTPGSGSIIAYQWDYEGDGVFDYASETTSTVSYTYNDGGIYNAVFRAVDEYGLTALDSSIIIRAGGLTAYAYADPQSGSVPLTVNFSGDFFDPVDGQVANYQWDFDNDGTFDFFSESTASNSYTYNKEGIYTAVFKVVDTDNSTAQDTVTITVEASAPTVDASAYPDSGQAPLNVRLYATGSDSDGSIVLYEWDYTDDGVVDWMNASLGEVYHIYDSPGDYTARVYVTDNDGLKTSGTVTVEVSGSLPAASAKVDKLRGEAPLAVNFTGGGKSRSGSIAQYEWATDLDDAGYAFNGENGSDGWYIDGAWELSNEDFYSPGLAWSDSVGGDYEPVSASELRSPIFDISHLTEPYLYLQTKFDFAYRDHGEVYISYDAGATWDRIALLTNSSDWSRRNYRLDADENLSAVQIRFLLRSQNHEAEDDGWYIDDIVFREPADYSDGDADLFPESADLTGQTGAHTYSEPGTYQPGVRVTDSHGGQAVNWAEVTVLPQGHPVASASASPEAGPAPLAVNFTGTGIDSNGSIIKYEWDFSGALENLYQENLLALSQYGFYRALAYNATTDHLIFGADVGGYNQRLDSGLYLVDPDTGTILGMLDNSTTMSKFSYHLEVTPSGKIFYADENSGIIYWSSESASAVTVFGGDADSDSTRDMCAIETGGQAYVYVVDYRSDGGREVRIFQLAGQQLNLVNTLDVSDMYSPYDMAVSSDGSVLYVNQDNNYPSRYVSDGGPTGTYTKDGGYSSAYRIDTMRIAEATAGVELVALSEGDSFYAFMDATGASARETIPIQSVAAYNTGLALDEANHRFFMGGSNSFLMANYYSQAAEYSDTTSGNTAHTFNIPGVYNPRFTVTDDSGTTDSVLVQVRVHAAPDVMITYPEEGLYYRRANLAFQAHAFDSDNEIVLYEWDFNNDGVYDSSSTSQSGASYTFSAKGEYTATVRVTDATGYEATDSVTFNILGEAPTVTASATPMSGNVEMEAAFSADGSDPDDDIVRYDWDVDGDGTNDLFCEGESGTVVEYPGVEYLSQGPEYLLDGDVSTYYLSQDGGQMPTNLVFELQNGETANVSMVGLNLSSSLSGWDRKAPKDFEVYVSTTSATDGFTKVYTGQTKAVEQTQYFTFTPTAARWVKLRVLNTFNNEDQINISEFSAWAGGENVLSAPSGEAGAFFSTPGVYTAQVTATDQDGNRDSDSVTVFVNPAESPAVQVDSVWTNPAYAGDYVYFYGSATDQDADRAADDGGEIVLYEWDLDGDGVYDSAQSMTVASGLVASDNSGASSWYSASELIDGIHGSSNGWRSSSTPAFPIEIVFQLMDANPGTSGTQKLNKVALRLDCDSDKKHWIKDFEILVSTTAADSGFSSAGTFQAARRSGDQVFSFAQTPATWVMLRVTSHYGEDEDYAAFGEFRAYDADHAFNLLCHDGDALYRYDSAGQYNVTIRATDDEGLSAQGGTVLDVVSSGESYGRVYVNSSNDDHIIEYDNQGNYLGSSERIDYPYAMVMDEAGQTLWAAARYGDAVKSYGLNLSLETHTTDMDGVQYVALDTSRDVVWAAVSTADTVCKIDADDGSLLATISGFDDPYGIAVYEGDGAVWVADRNTDRLVRLDGNIADGYDVDTDSGSHLFVSQGADYQLVAVNPGTGSCLAFSDDDGTDLRYFSADGSTLLWSKSTVHDITDIFYGEADDAFWMVDDARNLLIQVNADGSLVRTVSSASPISCGALNPLDGTIWASHNNSDAYFCQFSPAGEWMATFSGPRYAMDLAIYSGQADMVNPPQVTAAADVESGMLPLAVNLSGTASDDGTIVLYEWDFDGDGVFDYASASTAAVAHSYNETGLHKPVLRVTDDSGMVAYDYHLDIAVGSLAALPSVTPEEAYAGSRFYFHSQGMAVNDEIVSYVWDYTSDGTMDYRGTSPATTDEYSYTPGEYLATLYVTGASGERASASVPYTVLASPPEAKGGATPSSGDSPLQVELSSNGSSDKDGSIVLYQWDTNGDGIFDWGSATNEKTYALYSRPGVYYPTLRVTDNDGNTGERQFKVTVNNAEPTVTLTAEPDEGNVPLTVRFEANVTDPDGEMARYDWDFQSDGIWDVSSDQGGQGQLELAYRGSDAFITGTSTFYTYTYNMVEEGDENGMITTTIRVIDDYGTTVTAESGVQLLETGVPMADLTVEPSEGNAPLDVTFTGSGTDEDGSIVRYLWDFGGTYHLSDGYPLHQNTLGSWTSLGEDDLASSRTGILDMNPSVGDIFEGKVWSHQEFSNGVFELDKIYGNIGNQYAYSLVYLYSPTSQTLRCHYGMTQSIRFWVDDALVESRSGDSYSHSLNYQFETGFTKGWHRVLLAVSVGTDKQSYWGYMYRFTDTEDAPVDLIYSLNDPYEKPPVLETTTGGNQPYRYTETGVYTATLTVEDNAGNTDTDSVSVSVVDNDPPVANATAYPTAGTAPLKVFFSPNAEDTDGTVMTYLWDFEGDGKWNYAGGNASNWINYRPETRTYTYNQPGTYQAVFRATDDDGFYDETVITIYVSEPHAPEAVGWADPEDGTAPLTVDFNGYGSTEGSTIQKFEWDFEGDGTYDWSSLVDGKTEHTYSTAGFYQAAFRVTDALGQSGTCPVFVDVKAEGSPTANFEADVTEGETDLVVTFSAAAEEGNGDITLFEYDFDGDGVYDQSEAIDNRPDRTVSYTYDSAGVYYATLRVTDANGMTDLARVKIDVLFSINVERGRQSFDPTLGETASINSVITGETDITLRIVNRMGETVRTLVDNETRSAGYYSDLWDGLDDSGNFLESAPYFFVMDYTWEGQTYHYDVTNDVNVSGYPPGVSYPSSFDPIKDRPFYAQYNLSKPAECTIYTFWAPGASPQYPVKTVILREPRKAATHVDIWDGTDENHNLVAPGTYTMSVWVWDLPDNTIMVASEPVVSDLSKDPDYFSPSFNPYHDDTGQLALNYRVSKPVTLHIVIEDEDNFPHRTMEVTHDEAGLFTTYWDGLDDSGNKVYPGVYKVGFWAEDAYGNRSRRMNLLLKVFY